MAPLNPSSRHTDTVTHLVVTHCAELLVPRPRQFWIRDRRFGRYARRLEHDFVHALAGTVVKPRDPGRRVSLAREHRAQRYVIDMDLGPTRTDCRGGHLSRNHHGRDMRARTSARRLQRHLSATVRSSLACHSDIYQLPLETRPTCRDFRLLRAETRA